MRRKREQWRQLAEGAPDDATANYLHRYRWINEWNADPKPFVWTKTADRILDTLAAYCTRINDTR